MKQKYWRLLTEFLEKRGFIIHDVRPPASTAIWFSSNQANQSSLHTWLKFEYKPRLQVLTAHLGWSDPVVHEFCLDALKCDWPKGYEWLSEVGVIENPTLLLFNLASGCHWDLNGMPMNTETDFSLALEQLANTGLLKPVSSEDLLDLLLADSKPFAWSESNSAIRIAQIAGLVKKRRLDLSVLDECALSHLALIQADMFGLGSADLWIRSLRSRVMCS